MYKIAAYETKVAMTPIMTDLEVFDDRYSLSSLRLKNSAAISALVEK